MHLSREAELLALASMEEPMVAVQAEEEVEAHMAEATEIMEAMEVTEAMAVECLEIYVDLKINLLYDKEVFLIKLPILLSKELLSKISFCLTKNRFLKKKSRASSFPLSNLLEKLEIGISLRYEISRKCIIYQRELKKRKGEEILINT